MMLWPSHASAQVKVESDGNDGIRVYESHDAPVAKEKFTPSSAESLVHDIILVWFTSVPLNSQSYCSHP